MRLTTIGGLVTALVIGANADSMTILEECGSFNQCSYWNSYYYTDFGAYKFNAKSECYTFGVPGMYEFCFDKGKVMLPHPFQPMPRSDSTTLGASTLPIRPSGRTQTLYGTAVSIWVQLQLLEMFPIQLRRGCVQLASSRP